MISNEQINAWRKKAEDNTPEIKYLERSPIVLGEVIKSKKSFFGYEFIRVEDIGEDPTFLIDQTIKLCFDFGEHIVGDLTFDVNFIGDNFGGPIKLKIILAEIPAEIGDKIDPYEGSISRGWFQDEIITVEDLPKTIKFSRRFAFQYLQIELLAKSFDYKVTIKNITCNCTTSAEHEFEQFVLSSLDDDLKNIDRVALRTLRNTMQSTFIDGPKRDKRLWLGDFPLLSQTNELTFRKENLAKRCFYLFASNLQKDDRIAACIYNVKGFQPGSEYIVDFSIMFGAYLLDYYKATNDLEFIKDLWPAAYGQVKLIADKISEDGIFINLDNSWVFIDWCEELNKEAAINGVIIYSLSKLSEIADILGLEQEKKYLDQIVRKMKTGSQGYFFNAEQRLFISGKDEQISWASQVWMIMGEVVNHKIAKEILIKMLAREDFVNPVTPFLLHYALEMLFKYGLKDEAIKIIKSYWGGMVTENASTFWEVYDSKNPKFSPYNSYLINSYCHSWSCTPSYFFRKYLT